MRYRRKARWLLLRPAGPSSSRLGGCTAEIIIIVIMKIGRMGMMLNRSISQASLLQPLCTSLQMVMGK